MTSRYHSSISDAVEDQEWDSFRAETLGGHHVRTSLWAQVKATVGMRAIRIPVTEDGRLIGRARILISNLPIVGTIGYVSRGPIFATDDAVLRKMLLDRLRGAARERGVRHLTIQPPTNGLEMAAALVDEGHRSTSQTVAPPASVVVDLTLPLDETMSKMHRSTRYDIRRTERQGIRVRGGSEADLDAYCRMVEETARRNGFRPFRPKYCDATWRVLEPRGYLRLTVAEYEDETIATQFSIPFGDTTINKLSLWSGRYGKFRPNEMLHWEVTRWSKDLGYSFHDFKGIDPLAAEALSDGDALSPKLEQSATRFKSGFGGDIRLFRGAYFTASSPIVRWLYGAVLPRVSNWKTVRRGVAMLRTGTRPESDGANGGSTG